MGATQTDNRPTPGKWILVMAAVLGAVLVISSIWLLSRALINSSVETAGNSSPPGSVAPANNATAMNTGLSQEEMIRRHDMAEQQAAPVIPAPVAVPPAIIPTNRNNDAVKLQKAKTKVNQRIIDRMKQYIRENPNADTWAIQEQIKKREQQGAQSQ